MIRSFSDPETHFEIVCSETSVSVDGYAHGEPKFIRCPICGADRLITEEPSPGIDELGHEPDCSQRWVRSRWWQEQFAAE